MVSLSCLAHIYLPASPARIFTPFMVCGSHSCLSYSHSVSVSDKAWDRQWYMSCLYLYAGCLATWASLCEFQGFPSHCSYSRGIVSKNMVPPYRPSNTAISPGGIGLIGAHAWCYLLVLESVGIGLVWLQSILFLLHAPSECQFWLFLWIFLLS